jgi:hypothetical protein
LSSRDIGGREEETATYTLREGYVGCGFIQPQKPTPSYNLTSNLKESLFEVKLGLGHLNQITP